jgi:signal transduction histidine kinase
MKVTLPGADDATRSLIASWGYSIVEPEDGVPSIGIGAANANDDFVNTPVDRAEFDARIQRIVDRRARTIDLVHDLRSPLNAVQGYADLIIEESSGEVHRFANQIRTAAVQMTDLLQKIRTKGV